MPNDDNRSLRLKLAIAKYTFYTSVAGGLLTLVVNLLQIFKLRQVETTALPVHVEPAPGPVYDAAYSGSVAFPVRWLLVIVCLLVALAAVLLWRRYRRQHQEHTERHMLL